MISADSIKVADSLKYTTPKGKVVYGGGGIIPDIFVPIGNNEEEAIGSDDYMMYFSYFAFEHLDKNRAIYASYSAEEFRDDFKVDDILFEEFIDYNNGRINIDFYAFEDKIKLYLKSALAEQLFGANTSAKIKSLDDTMLQSVLRLDNPDYLPKETNKVEVKD